MLLCFLLFKKWMCFSCDAIWQITFWSSSLRVRPVPGPLLVKKEMTPERMFNIWESCGGWGRREGVGGLGGGQLSRKWGEPLRSLGVCFLFIISIGVSFLIASSMRSGTASRLLHYLWKPAQRRQSVNLLLDVEFETFQKSLCGHHYGNFVFSNLLQNDIIECSHNVLSC